LTSDDREALLFDYLPFAETAVASKFRVHCRRPAPIRMMKYFRGSRLQRA
jgi:hypothetical protein